MPNDPNAPSSFSAALAASLSPAEREAIVAAGGDPDACTALEFPIGWPGGMQPQSMTAKGIVFMARFATPHWFTFLGPGQKVVVGPDGKAMPPDLSKAIPLAPVVRLVVRQDALTVEARMGLERASFASSVPLRS